MWNILPMIALVFTGMAMVCLWIAAAIVLTFIVWTAPTMIINWFRRSRERQKPIVCVCQVDNRIGVVLRRDYDKASRNFWKPYLARKEQYFDGDIDGWGGRKIPVEPIFVVDCGSPLFPTLIDGCYVEKAVFYVPPFCIRYKEEFRKTYHYIHGRPWNGKLTYQ